MDCSLPVVPDGGDLPWSDSRSGDACGHGIMAKPVPGWMAHPTPATATSHMHVGPLSPVSTGMDIPSLDAAGSASASASDATAAFGTSASSVSTWGSALRTDEELDFDQDINWEQAADNSLQGLKIEPADEDDFHMEDVNPISGPVSENSEHRNPAPDQRHTTKVKRPRGRPRKHPRPPAVSGNKVTKGRSKTGCITCRKRKKKCDEAKPRCE